MSEPRPPMWRLMPEQAGYQHAETGDVVSFDLVADAERLLAHLAERWPWAKDVPAADVAAKGYCGNAFAVQSLQALLPADHPDYRAWP